MPYPSHSFLSCAPRRTVPEGALLPRSLTRARSTHGPRYVDLPLQLCIPVAKCPHDLASSMGRPAYDLSKGAVHHLTKILAHEFAPLKVRVNGFAPGLYILPRKCRAVPRDCRAALSESGSVVLPYLGSYLGLFE